MKLTKRQRLMHHMLVALGHKNKRWLSESVRTFAELPIDDQDIALHSVALLVAPTKEDCRNVLNAPPLCEFFDESEREELIARLYAH